LANAPQTPTKANLQAEIKQVLFRSLDGNYGLLPRSGTSDNKRLTVFVDMAASVILTLAVSLLAYVVCHRLHLEFGAKQELIVISLIASLNSRLRDTLSRFTKTYADLKDLLKD